MKIYLVRDGEDFCVEAVYFNEISADVHCRGLGESYDVTSFDTLDEPKDSIDEED